jgi:hypothetical protein
MPTPKPRPVTKRAKAAAAAAEDLTTSEGVAQSIRTESIDLTPSVNRIMNAGLHEAACFQALTLFRASLGVPGDPNRHPDHAIEAGRKVKEKVANPA